MTATAVEPEPAEWVAAAAAALTRALTGAVTEADGCILNAAVEQVQCRLDAQDGRPGRVTYDVTDDHPGQTRGRPGGRGGAVRSVQLELPGGVGTSLAALSEATGKDMAYLMATAVTLLHYVAEHLSAGRRVYAEDPDSGRRSAMTLDWA